MNLLKSIAKQCQNFWILSNKFSQFKTISNWDCKDSDGNEIPWYTYPAIEYLSQFNFNDKIILEFGSGNSTLFWAKRASRVVSIEHNKEWFDKVNDMIPYNVEYILSEEPDYVSHGDGKYDVVVIDGIRRFDCARKSLDIIKDGGIIILDNSDSWQKTAQLLRDSGLIQVDFFGFGPINNYTWCTSVFFKRDTVLEFKGEMQPKHAIGGVKNIEK